jgi:uncharacterized membrane protein
MPQPLRLRTASPRGSLMLILKVLGIWTAVSVVTSFIVAPALSRRLRDVNFPAKDE